MLCDFPGHSVTNIVATTQGDQLVYSIGDTLIQSRDFRNPRGEHWEIVGQRFTAVASSPVARSIAIAECGDDPCNKGKMLFTLHCIQFDGTHSYHQMPECVSRISWSPDGERIAVVSGGSGTVEIWNKSPFGRVATISRGVERFSNIGLSWSESGKHLCVSGRQGFTIWETGGFTVYSNCRDESVYVSEVKLLNDSGVVACEHDISGEYSTRPQDAPGVRVSTWDIRSKEGKRVKQQAITYRTARISASGQRVCYAPLDRTCLHLVDVK